MTPPLRIAMLVLAHVSLIDTLALSQSLTENSWIMPQNKTSAKTEDRYSLSERLRRTLCHELWNIGIIPQTAADIVRSGLTTPVQWLPSPGPRRMLADPSCRVRHDGGLTIYAEYLDYRQPRGEIWSSDIPPGVHPATARFQRLLAQPFHMSYPFPFVDDSGQQLLTAETYQANGALLWRDTDAGCLLAGELFSGAMVVDPTLFRAPDYWWLFCTFQDDDPNGRLHLFYTGELGKPWSPHRRNPVKTNSCGSRSAGPIFKVDDLLVRPAQDCSRTYGGAVVLQVIRRLDPDQFEEEPLRRIEPTKGPYATGLHTFCPAGDVTLIDGRRWAIDAQGVARLAAAVRRFPAKMLQRSWPRTRSRA
jgi:hypothetical protein